jgi:DNA-binding CsgD family transcriptional regulator
VRRKVEIEQYLSKLNLAEAKRKKQITTRNSLVTGIVLLAAIGLLLVNRARIRNEKKLAEAAFENQLAEEKLRNLQNELEQFTQRMREKTSLAEKFAAELESIRRKDDHEDFEKAQTMEALLQSSILTEDEWQHFRNLFDKVHPGYLTRLRMRLPDLTPAETRLLVLTKLQLTNKEMTAMLGIGYDAIKKTRQRLRKKLQLSGDESFDELLDQG